MRTLRCFTQHWYLHHHADVHDPLVLIAEVAKLAARVCTLCAGEQLMKTDCV
jgi:hypothetical protein